MILGMGAFFQTTHTDILRYCDSHWNGDHIKILQKIPGGIKLYKEDPVFKQWCQEFRSLNALPGGEIADAHEEHLNEAFSRFTLNGRRPRGNKPPGRLGSRIRIAWDYWSRVKRTFINGSHSTVGALSWNEEVADRNNQGNLSERQSKFCFCL